MVSCHHEAHGRGHRRRRHTARRLDLGPGPARVPGRLVGNRLRLRWTSAQRLLDQWLSGNDTEAPGGLAKLTRLPAGHWTGEHAATDILTLARKGRAFASLDALIARQGGRHVLYGSALVLAAALQAWSRHADTPVIDLARTVIR